ncbi:MAG TPA: MerR family transcriptional regulator [Azospira sp.]|nr:MerR family transcriptional regulator [Azospira sp.]
MKSYLTIQEVAESTGLSPHTLRYYERIGLIGAVPRGPGGQRRYVRADMEWLAFLLRLRSTGMPVGRMQEFAALRREGPGTAGARRLMLEAHLDGVRESIRALEETAAVLALKVAHYRQMETSLSEANDQGERDAHRAICKRPGETEGN